MKKDLLSKILLEAQAYSQFSEIEKLVETKDDLSFLPIQPLYIALKNLSPDQMSLALSKLSSEQRQALLDIDLWKKDALDHIEANRWIELFSKCKDENVVREYVTSEDFLLTVKSQIVVRTFDQEDPEYPEHDNFFVTDDQLLLFEYSEDFQYPDELQGLIRTLYSELGVEEAYSFLFKMVTDSYLTMEEDEYRLKKDRLRDFGFVDYYDALEFKSPFPTLQVVDQFVSNKKKVTGELEVLSLNQTLHSSSLVSFQTGMDSIQEELIKLSDEKRQAFVQFSFIRLVNARIVVEDALKGGSLAMTVLGQQTRQALNLGFSYLKFEKKVENIFESYDFCEIYKIGLSLLEIEKRAVKKSLHQLGFEDENQEAFLGMYWNNFLDHSLSEMVKFKFDGSSEAKEVSDIETYHQWASLAGVLVGLLPFIQNFYKSLQSLKNQGLLNDQFYLNYSVDDIDFEAIIISSIINFSNGHFDKTENPKMGITVDELKIFYKTYFTKFQNEYLAKGIEDQSLNTLLSNFAERFGMTKVRGITRYFHQIIVEQMNGYEVDEMTTEDFKHVGGAIILQNLKN